MRRINRYIIAGFLAVSGSCFGSIISDVTSSGYSVLTNGSLSTDNGVSIDGNIGAKSLWLANNTTVDGDINTGSISTGNNVSISGDLTYGSSFWMPKTSSVDGTVSKSSWQAVSISPAVVTSGSQSLYYDKNSSVNLAAGSYSSLSVSKGSTVYLSSGVYNFTTARFDSNVRIVADTSAGDVIINTAKSFTTSQQVKFVTSGSGNTYIVSAGSFAIDKHNEIAASILANTTGSVAQSSTINGLVYANNSLQLGNGVEISGLSSISSPAVPEPATALLLLSGIPLLKRRNKRA